jgi:predicted outer membrane repeat protein
MSGKRSFTNSIGGSSGSRGATMTSVNYNQSKGHGGLVYSPKASFGHFAAKPEAKASQAPGPAHRDMPTTGSPAGGNYKKSGKEK